LRKVARNAVVADCVSGKIPLPPSTSDTQGKTMRIARALSIVIGSAAVLLASAALAQTYPTKPVKLIVTT
jgi:hypothetical protein